MGGKRKRGKGTASSETETGSKESKGPGDKTRETSAGRANLDEPSGREQLFCEVSIRRHEEVEDDDVPVGFVHLSSQKASFAEVRRYIKQDLDTIPVERSWVFWVPGKGALSTRDEPKVGSMLAYLWRASSKDEVGEGTYDSPVRVILVDAPKG